MSSNSVIFYLVVGLSDAFLGDCGEDVGSAASRRLSPMPVASHVVSGDAENSLESGESKRFFHIFYSSSRCFISLVFRLKMFYLAFISAQDVLSRLCFS